MARNQFKWLWLHTPTYAAYKVEGTYVPLLLAAGAATRSARSAILVLRSLTPNAQCVFRVLGEFQIGHPDDQGREDSGWLLVPCVRISDLVALSSD
jgi:origin recognition complex subunit 2